MAALLFPGIWSHRLNLTNKLHENNMFQFCSSYAPLEGKPRAVTSLRVSTGMWGLGVCFVWECATVTHWLAQHESTFWRGRVQISRGDLHHVGWMKQASSRHFLLLRFPLVLWKPLLCRSTELGRTFEILSRKAKTTAWRSSCLQPFRFRLHKWISSNLIWTEEKSGQLVSDKRNVNGQNLLFGAKSVLGPIQVLGFGRSRSCCQERSHKILFVTLARLPRSNIKSVQSWAGSQQELSLQYSQELLSAARATKQ